jgi:hypothetical protein
MRGMESDGEGAMPLVRSGQGHDRLTVLEAESSSCESSIRQSYRFAAATDRSTSQGQKFEW